MNRSGSQSSAPIFPHTAILASAGAGKTFQLSNRYLGLLASGAPVSSILASTFTRAAAGEIRDRILQRLAEAAGEDAKRKELSRWIKRDLDRADVIALLRSITNQLHRIQIRTLDSFFGTVVRSFALELGIAPGSEIVDETSAEHLRFEAIRLMLDERDPQQLINLLRMLTQGTSDRSIMDAIDQTVRSLHELYREATPEAWECVPRFAELKEAELVEAIQRLESADPGSNGHHRNAHTKDCERARNRLWDEFIAKGLAKAIANGELYHAKEIDSALIEVYKPLIAHARAILVNRLHHQTIATRDLLELYDRQLRVVKRRARAHTFADITSAMREAQERGTFAEICFRIDAQIRHLLLDEFQDTSVAQWRALDPIAGEIVASDPRERSFFCVGDVKQSIYGWRGACPEILESTPQMLLGPDGGRSINTESLAESYRSAPEVMEAVNRVFGTIESNPAIAGVHDDAASQFARGFTEHSTARHDRPGYVELRTVRRAEKGEEKARVRIQAAAQLVSRLHAAAPQHSIAVLARRNEMVSRLLFEFTRAPTLVHASGRGGGPLTDAAPVNAMLDLLRLADHPADTISAFNVALSPLGALLDFHDPFDESRRTALSRHVRRLLLDRGAADVISQWVQQLAPACDERSYRRLLHVIELAAKHDEGGSLRADDLVALVEQQRVAEDVPAPVEVMTIHQAKGLEFDIVVLCELEDQVVDRRRHPNAVFENASSAVGGARRVSRWASESVRSLVPELDPLFAQYELRAGRDSLCVLYVAMTRAKLGLFMLIDPPAEKENTFPKTLAGVVRGAVANGKIVEPEQTLIEIGDESRMLAHDREMNRKHEEDGGDECENAERIQAISLMPSKGTAGRSAIEPSASAQPDSGKALRDQLRVTDDASRARGRALHGLFERIEWLDQAALVDEEMLADLGTRNPRRDRAWAVEIVRMFRAALEQPTVCAALSRPRENGERIRLWRERPYVITRCGAIESGVIDRLIAWRSDDAGGWSRAHIIDFKTDEISSELAPARAEHYRAQLDAYREAVARMLRVDLQAIRRTLLFVSAGALIDLD